MSRAWRLWRSARTALVLFTLFTAISAHAQWRTQNVPLSPGWNAVLLEVQPDPRDLDTCLAGRSVESVWKWDRRFTSFEFSIDPYTLEPENPHWMVWLPPSDPRRFLNHLLEFEGWQTYLIKVPSNAAPYTLSVTGRVVLARTEWFPHVLNLVGFPVNTNNPPTFTTFFKFTPEVDTTKGVKNQLFTISTAGKGTTVVLPAKDKMQAGRAYWVGCARRPAYMGPMQVTPSGGGAVDFGSVVVQQELAIENVLASGSITACVMQVASAAPSPGSPELAGPVALSYMTRNASNQWEWHEFPLDGLSQKVAPGETWTLYLGVRRQDMPDYTPAGTNGAEYQSILEVTDAPRSLMVRVPVTASKAQGTTTWLGPHHESEGLWVGAVALDQVNAPAYSGTNLLRTPSPASFRLIVHVDGDGQARLLQQVLLAWDSSLCTPPHTNGTYALFVRDADVPADAEEANRISSAAFPPKAPALLSGAFGSGLAGAVILSYDDPTNPFLHRYHPNHDNKDWDFVPYTTAVETYTVGRAIEMEFEAPATNTLNNPYWGEDSAIGIYRETMTGLRAQPIVVQGRFYLKRISRINELQ
jgi:hypothetical protein